MTGNAHFMTKTEVVSEFRDCDDKYKPPIAIPGTHTKVGPLGDVHALGTAANAEASSPL